MMLVRNQRQTFQNNITDLSFGIVKVMVGGNKYGGMNRMKLEPNEMSREKSIGMK